MGASRRQLGWESRHLRGIHRVGVRHGGRVECYLVVSQYRSTAFIRTVLPLLLVPFYRFYSYRSTAFTRTVLPLLLVTFTLSFYLLLRLLFRSLGDTISCLPP